MNSGKDYEFYRLIKRVHLGVSQQLDELLKEHNLARSQFQVMYLTGEKGELAGKELLAKLRVEPATLSGIVDSLEQKKLIMRLPDPVDARAKILKLTSRGKKLLKKLPGPATEVEKRMLKGLNASDKADLKRLLEQILVNLGKS